MPKLTSEQIRLLLWLSLPSTVFEISREDGLMDDKYNGLQTFLNTQGKRYKFDIRTLYRLEEEELVLGHIVYHFGIAWERYELTEKGQVFVSLICIAEGWNEI